jgi:hypothetical protein
VQCLLPKWLLATRADNMALSTPTRIDFWLGYWSKVSKNMNTCQLSLAVTQFNRSLARNETEWNHYPYGPRDNDPKVHQIYHYRTTPILPTNSRSSPNCTRPRRSCQRIFGKPTVSTKLLVDYCILTLKSKPMIPLPAQRPSRQYPVSGIPRCP